MSSPEEDVIQTPLTDIFQRLKELAAETNLLYVMDVEALEKLAMLNLLQQKADQLDEHAPEQKALDLSFKQLYNSLHELNNYFIHRDDQTRIWRLGTYLSRKQGGRRW
jgi:hypothetical protein